MNFESWFGLSLYKQTVTRLNRVLLYASLMLCFKIKESYVDKYNFSFLLFFLNVYRTSSERFFNANKGTKLNNLWTKPKNTIINISLTNYYEQSIKALKGIFMNNVSFNIIRHLTTTITSFGITKLVKILIAANFTILNAITSSWLTFNYGSVWKSH